MCKAIEDMRKEERMETSIETVKRMLNDGLLSCEKIAEYTGLSLNEVLALKEIKFIRLTGIYSRSFFFCKITSSCMTVLIFIIFSIPTMILPTFFDIHRVF